MEIFPSLISADLLNLESVIKKTEPYCDGFHIDVMDDHFVPNLTWGPSFVNSIINTTYLPIHLHLMVDEPEKWVNRVNLRSKDSFIFHYESVVDNDRILRLINLVKISGYRVGIAVNPKTNINKIFDYVDNIDDVLLMSVEPGFSGQKFISSVLSKVDHLINQRNSMNLHFKIGMDGGIGKDNISIVRERGVDIIGAATSIFSGSNFVDNLKDLNKN